MEKKNVSGSSGVSSEKDQDETLNETATGYSNQLELQEMKKTIQELRKRIDDVTQKCFSLQGKYDQLLSQFSNFKKEIKKLIEKIDDRKEKEKRKKIHQAIQNDQSYKIIRIAITILTVLAMIFAIYLSWTWE